MSKGTGRLFSNALFVGIVHGACQLCDEFASRQIVIALRLSTSSSRDGIVRLWRSPRLRGGNDRECASGSTVRKQSCDPCRFRDTILTIRSLVSSDFCTGRLMQDCVPINRSGANL